MKYHKNEKSNLIGMSLSLCVREMVDRGISPDNISKLVTATKAHNREEFALVCAEYCKTYWRGVETECTTLAFYLWDTGKIEQPRITKDICYYIGDGKWADSEDDFVEW